MSERKKAETNIFQPPKEIERLSQFFNPEIIFLLIGDINSESRQFGDGHNHLPNSGIFHRIETLHPTNKHLVKREYYLNNTTFGSKFAIDYSEKDQAGKNICQITYQVRQDGQPGFSITIANEELTSKLLLPEFGQFIEIAKEYRHSDISVVYGSGDSVILLTATNQSKLHPFIRCFIEKKSYRIGSRNGLLPDMQVNLDLNDPINFALEIESLSPESYQQICQNPQMSVFTTQLTDQFPNYYAIRRNEIEFWRNIKKPKQPPRISKREITEIIKENKDSKNILVQREMHFFRPEGIKLGFSDYRENPPQETSFIYTRKY